MMLQVQRDVYLTHLQRCPDQMHYFTTNHNVPRSNDPGKDKIGIIFEKNTTPVENELDECPFYIKRVKRWLITTKRLWVRVQYPHLTFTI